LTQLCVSKNQCDTFCPSSDLWKPEIAFFNAGKSEQGTSPHASNFKELGKRGSMVIDGPSEAMFKGRFVGCATRRAAVRHVMSVRYEIEATETLVTSQNREQK